MLNVHAVKNTRAPAQAKKMLNARVAKKRAHFSASKQKTFRMQRSDYIAHASKVVMQIKNVGGRRAGRNRTRVA
jgi:hypothetical protein